MQKFPSAAPTAVLGVACLTLLAGPAAASQVDSWGGHVFLHHESDVLAYPHRALEFRNSAMLVYVPPTSTGGDFNRAPADRQEVAGVITFGGNDWSGIVGGNVPNPFNPLQAYGSGSDRGMGAGLVRGDILQSHLTQGINSSFSPQPMAKMQLGAAYQATEDVRVGVSFQQFGQEWTDDTVLGTNPSEKIGFDINGYNVTGSGQLGLTGPVQSVQLGFSYGTSDAEEFSPVDGVGGKGDASTYSLSGIVDFGDLGWFDTKHGMNYGLYAQYDNTSSWFMDDAIDGSPDPAPKVDDDCYNYNFRIGFTHEDEQIFSTSVGIQGMNEKENFRFLFGDSFAEEVKAMSMPSCDAAGEVPVSKRIAIDYGVAVNWWNVETTQTDRDMAGDLVSRSKVVDTTVTTSYHLGLVWRPLEDFRLSATLDTDQLGDPGGTVFGNNNDAPVIAFGAKYTF